MEMLIFQFILIAALVSAISCVDLEVTKVSKGYKEGDSKSCIVNRYIIALKIGNFNERGGKYLDELVCRKPISQWDNGEGELFKLVYLRPYTDEARWFLCPAGYYLSGFRRDAYFTGKKGTFDSIMAMRCVRPAAHPLHYDKCMSRDVAGALGGDLSCHESDNFIIGLHKEKNIYFNIDKIACCSMAQKPKEIDSTEDIKTRIMERNLKPLVDLAALMGFHSCGGIRADYCTEGYKQKEYKWQAQDDNDYSHTYCPGHGHCLRRLGIVYENWGLAVKEMKFGKIETSSLQPETVDHGTIYNRADAKVTESYLISKTVSNTVTNTKTTTVNFGHEASAKIEIDVAKLFEGTMSYTFRYDTSNTKTEQEETFNSTTYTTHSQITLEPMTVAKYNVTFSQSKSFANYTVVVLVTFSVKLTGALKTGGKFFGNNHHLYQDNEEETYVQYSFGDKNIPFYKALKSESEYYAQPWLWKDIKDSKDSNVSSLIHRLTDERQYEFELKGHLEGVAGAKIQVAWQTMPIEGP